MTKNNNKNTIKQTNTKQTKNETKTSPKPTNKKPPKIFGYQISSGPSKPRGEFFKRKSTEKSSKVFEL